MCDAECRICWFKKSDKVVHELQAKSLEITGQLNEVTKSVQIVQNFIKDFVHAANHLEQLTDNKPDCFKDVKVLPVETTKDVEQVKIQDAEVLPSPVDTEEQSQSEIAKDDSEKALESAKNHVWDKKSEDKIIFLSVSSGLSNDGTFWCRPWSNEVPFKDSRLHEMSDEFAWLDKDLAAEKAETKASDDILFCYSKKHDLYLRTMILKYAPSSDIEVRYVDISKVEFVSTNTVFYKVPDDNLTIHPFLNLFCSLYLEEPKPIPREAKWHFRDITEEKVLIGRIVGEFLQNGMKCHQVEMKTMAVSPQKNINMEIKQMIVDSEKEEKRKEEEKQRYQRKKSDSKNSKSVSPTTQSNVKSVKPEGKSQPSVEKLPLLKKPIISDGLNKLWRCNSVPSSLSQIKLEDALKQSSSLSNIAKMDSSIIDFKKKDDSQKTWVDDIPEKDRRKVPKNLPPLRNLFYNKTTVRMEKWDEIEMMNITELLRSESKTSFYSFSVHIDQIEQSFWDNNMIYMKSPKGSRTWDSKVQKQNYAKFQMIKANMGYHSQYFFLIDSASGNNKGNIIGLARIEGIRVDHNGMDAQLDVSYYSISCIGKHKIIYAGGSSEILQSSAKSIVEKMKESLESGNSIPIFENYFPWCGIPPLIKFEKPTFAEITPRNPQRKNSRDNKKKKERKDSKSNHRDSRDDIRGKNERKDKGNHRDDHRQRRDSSNHQNREESSWEVQEDSQTHARSKRRSSGDVNWRMSQLPAAVSREVDKSNEINDSVENGYNSELHIDNGEVWNNDMDIKENSNVDVDGSMMMSECLNEEKKQTHYPFIVDTSSLDGSLWDESGLKYSLTGNEKGIEIQDEQKTISPRSIDDPNCHIKMTNGEVKILQRTPSENIGYYDSSGVWYPDDSAIITCQLQIPSSNVEMVTDGNPTESLNYV